MCRSIRLLGIGVAVYVARVLRRPALGRFIRPFHVAGLGARCLVTQSLFMHGIPCKCPFLIASSKVVMGGLKNA